MPSWKFSPFPTNQPGGDVDETIDNCHIFQDLQHYLLFDCVTHSAKIVVCDKFSWK